MLANILRAGILAASAALPENAPVANVVFASSMQILISVGYFLVYTTIIATYRVLSARDAMQDPAMQREVSFNADVDYDDGLDLDDDENLVRPLPKTKMQMLHDVRNRLHREADRIACNMFGVHSNLSQRQNVNDIDLTFNFHDHLSESSENCETVSVNNSDIKSNLKSHANTNPNTKGNVNLNTKVKTRVSD
jgi:hypothetical protein